MKKRLFLYSIRSTFSKFIFQLLEVFIFCLYDDVNLLQPLFISTLLLIWIKILLINATIFWLISFLQSFMTVISMITILCIWLKDEIICKPHDQNNNVNQNVILYCTQLEQVILFLAEEESDASTGFTNHNLELKLQGCNLERPLTLLS